MMFASHVLSVCTRCKIDTLDDVIFSPKVYKQNFLPFEQVPTLQQDDVIYIRLSLVAFQLWRVLEQLAPGIFLNFFFKTGDLSMVQLTQKNQKSEKK